ncbi:5-oxoprolinase subunit PxpA [Paramicrobacterium humi]|uniref:5-oxoprolinase subunit PxpA n=1 Tax=Paramicrobacterium humi TaxID=640635 RepID=UPI000B82BC0C|nr:5-oxoprolinase subunit PxpA [Microbacterium humi]
MDLNCDLGETVDGQPTADDAAMFPLITSANVACGFHAGDAATMQVSCERAVQHVVAVGAHVSYADRENFGRTDLEVDDGVLEAQIREQLEALAEAAEAAGTRVRYVKPHGALYNRIARDRDRADVVAAAVSGFDPALPLMGLPGSHVADAAAAAGLRFLREAFVDRNYLADGSLVPRSRPDALLAGGSVALRAVRIVTDGAVTAVDGTLLRLEVDSLCVHGDSPGAVEMARAVRRELDAAGVSVEARA